MDREQSEDEEKKRRAEATAGEEAEADEDREDVKHAQDVVKEVRRPEEQRGGDPEGREVSKIVQLGA